MRWDRTPTLGMIPSSTRCWPITKAASSAMVDMAADARARLLFVTPLPNLRDFAPFKSENRGGLTPSSFAHGRKPTRRDECSRNGQLNEAVREFDAALAIDDRHADLLYRKGRPLLELGEDSEAKDYLERARDEDVCPLRALPSTLEIMRRVASKRGVPWLISSGWPPRERTTRSPARTSSATTCTSRSMRRRCWRSISSRSSSG